MKKLSLLVFALFSFTLVTNAQVYTGAAGLGIDFGGGISFVGPSGKYFFQENHAAQADIGFGTGVTALTFLYQYHGQFSGADTLQWFAGVGPSIFLGNGGGSAFALRPEAGLDFKIPDVPLALSFSWRPAIGLSNGGGFQAGAFGLGFRYAFD